MEGGKKSQKEGKKEVRKEGSCLMMLERQQGASGGPGVVRKEGRKEVQKKGKKQRKETVVRGSRTNRGRKVDQRQWEKEGSWRRGGS